MSRANKNFGKDKSSLILYILIDTISILMAWWGSFYIRFYLFPGGEKGLFDLFLYITPIIIFLELFYSNKYHLYKFQSLKSWHLNIFSMLKAQSRAILVIIGIFYFIFPNKITRIGILLYYILALILTLVSRTIVQNILYKYRKSKGLSRKILIIGCGSKVKKFVEQNLNNSSRLVTFAGWYDDHSENIYGIKSYTGELSEILKEKHFDMIVIGYPSHEGEQLDRVLAVCYDKFLPVMILPSLSYSFLNNHMEDYKGVPTIYMNHFHHSLLDRFVKRIMDIIFSLFGLIIFSPIFFIIPILIKITSPGPVFFGQTRMGREGSTFTIWKFRSMKVNAEADSGAVWAKKDDSRKTSIGSFLRATSLDEIPQFWNVLKGEMSLVGPRPERPELIVKFKDEIPGYMLRHKMKAGITGWAQVNGWRGNTSLRKRIEYDLYYINNWSVILDLKILVLTVLKGFINKNAY